jgi:two-component system phosphate regulon sensor histidine kinase PhoR
MSSKSAYPWFFFYRIARLTLVVFLPTLFVILFLYRSSYRSGLVSQMSSQIEEDLHLIQHTLDRSKTSWEEWCSNLPALKDVQYSLIRKDGTVLCDSMNHQTEGKKIDELAGFQEAEFSAELSKSSIFGTQAVFASMKLENDLMIRKVIPVSSFRDNMDRFDRVLFLRIVPFAVLSYFLFIFLFYRTTRPLGLILSKVEKFKDDIPFNKSLALLYQRDEWGAIEEALNKADQRLQHQVLEAKLENEKTTAILESINDDIIAVDRYESILFFNSKFKNNFMTLREGQEINKKIWHIFADDVLIAFRSVLTTGEPSSLKAINFPMSLSPNRFFDLTITPLKASNGAIKGALGVFYDVTEFKLTEQMRVDFVANVSHEIRTPLTSIKGFTQILQSQSSKVDEALHPFLEKIVANTERMISLFNDLLNLSVIESGNYLHSEEFPLNSVVEGVEGNIIASYPNKKVTFADDLKLDHLKGDFRLIEQVILNLCDNACKYAEETVHIKISSFEKDGKACLTINDNGPGISKEHLSRIFERFYRVDASRESLRGTGLGLAIVKQIVSKHKGRIWAESLGLGQGTTFVMEFPLE